MKLFRHGNQKQRCLFLQCTQDEHYDGRIPSYTTAYPIVYGRIRRKLRSYFAVFRRIFVVYLTPELRPWKSRVVYDQIRRKYDHRKWSYTIVYNVVSQRILINFSYLPLPLSTNTETKICSASLLGGLKSVYAYAPSIINFKKRLLTSYSSRIMQITIIRIL